ncbi:MAG: penicillin acylase family protein [Myxococcota bacterium]
MTRWMLIGLAIAACRSGTDDEANTSYNVDIRTTEFGIPHISADDFFSAGVGVGFALASDHICIVADQFVKVNSQRAQYHGPGDNDVNINRDFGWLGLGVRRIAEENFDSLPDDSRAMMEGFVEGYNRYLADTPVGEIDPRCGGAAWVQPITPLDLFTYYMSLAQEASGRVLVDVVGTAQPPAALRSGVNPFPPPDESWFDRLEELRLGSNGWGIGSERSEGGRGMLLANPHFPSDGPLKLWEHHITIPDVLNVYGVGLLNSPVPLIAFNERLAWTHTVSPTPRFVVYQHTLDPTDPTRYEFDGEFVDMERTRYTIEVLEEDGSMGTRSRTLYRTQYGPMFNAPVAGWAQTLGYSFRDANAPNTNVISTFQGAGQALTLEEFEQNYRETQGIPWVHTMYADFDGNAFYVDSAAAPNMSAEAFGLYQELLAGNALAQNFAASGIWVVDGAVPENTWVEDPRAVIPGNVPYDDAPRLVRNDFIMNANQNYWATNPAEPLSGFNAIYGPPEQTLTPRSKMNLRYLLEENGASGDDFKFSLEELASAALDGRAAIAEDLKDQVVARCTGAAPVTVGGETVDLTQACGLLDGWNGQTSVDAVGAIVWREFVLVDGDRGSLQDQGRLYADAWDVNDPVYTPSTLVDLPKEGQDPVLVDLATAVLRLQQANVALDAPLGDVQFYERLGQRFARPGGQQPEGHIAIADFGSIPDSVLPYDIPPPAINPVSDLRDGGYRVNNGNSFVMALEFTDDGPRAQAILTYAQSDAETSDHATDQLEIYARGEMRDVKFTEEDILADPTLETISLSSDDE